MFFKQLVLFCALISPAYLSIDVQVCWPDMGGRTELRNTKVISAEYWIRYYPFLHAGVLVNLAKPVEGRTRWLIHKIYIKGGSYNEPDTIVTSVGCLTDKYSTEFYRNIYSCNKNVNDFLMAGYRNYKYNFFTANCLTAAKGMWDMVTTCKASSETKPLNYFLLCLIVFSLIQQISLL